MTVNTAIPVSVSNVRGVEARLCRKVSLGVRIIWITYVVKSKIELVGPIHTMKFPTLEASHLRGTAINSSSTLSHGIAVQDRS